MTADVLDYGVIEHEVKTLRIATENKLQRERIPRLDEVRGAQPLISSLFRVAGNVFRAVMFLCADVPSDPMRHLEFAVAAPPLVRALVDSLFSIVFIFDDLPLNVPWYWTSGWREMHRRYVQCEARHRGDPEWAALLALQRGFVERSREEWGVARHEERVPRARKRWPHPGGMLKQARCPERRELLQYLNDWFYGPLSSSTHLSAPGLGTSAALLLAREHLEDYEARLLKFKSDQVFMALTLLLAIVSELQIELTLSLADRLGYLWVIISKYAWGADDLYGKRYQRGLGFQVVGPSV